MPESGLHKQFDLREERIAILKRYALLLRAWRFPKDKKEQQLVRKALNLAVEAHKDMRRKSGEPYIYHPLEVAHIVASEIGLGTTSIICALLHDVVEDTDYTLADIEDLFGEKVAKIIDGLTKIKGIFDFTSESAQAENYKKMLLTLSDDVRVILIKLADRLHNMRTLDAMSPAKQLKIASETTYLYAPLAHRLGLFSIKSELEDLALKYMEPEIYRTVSQKLKESEEERNAFIEEFIHPIRRALTDQGIPYEIFGRTKSIYSIWRKMRKKEIPFEEVYDLFAIRIIIESPLAKEKTDCWRVYSIITDFYRPNLDRLRDWIAFPKSNGYEALHATLMSHTGKWVEVQIRTRRMDEIAEKGYAAHWKYKDNGSESGLDDWLARVRELLEGNTEEDALDFLSDFKLNLFHDEIFIFTPKGDMKTIPGGSTALDFAYHIHSEIGNTAIAAKVNLKLVPLSHVLRTGDQVEIITSRKQKPKAEWLKFVRTAKAISYIKSALKDDRQVYFDAGKDKLERILAQLSIEPTRPVIIQIQRYTGRTNLIDLYFDFAHDLLGMKEVRECFGNPEKNNWFRKISRPFTRQSKPGKSLTEEVEDTIKKNKGDFLIEGSKASSSFDVSPCCLPIPGDEIVGFISPGEPTRLHRSNCPEAVRLMSRFGDRIVKTNWMSNNADVFLSGVKLRSIDRPGLISEIAAVITGQYGLNIKTFNLSSTGEVCDATIMFMVTGTQQLEDTIAHLRKIQGMQRIERIGMEAGTAV